MSQTTEKSTAPQTPSGHYLPSTREREALLLARMLSQKYKHKRNKEEGRGD